MIRICICWIPCACWSSCTCCRPITRCESFSSFWSHWICCSGVGFVPFSGILVLVLAVICLLRLKLRSVHRNRPWPWMLGVLAERNVRVERGSRSTFLAAKDMLLRRIPVNLAVDEEPALAVVRIEVVPRTIRVVTRDCDLL